MNGKGVALSTNGLQMPYAQVQSIKFLNIFAFIAVVAINMLAQTLPLEGKTTADISAMYPTLLTPAGITFGIWLLIYLLLGIYVVQQAIVKTDQPTKEIGLAFTFSCAMNIAWVVCWHYEVMFLATAAIVGLWISLWMISERIEGENWTFKAIFGIYYAWISLATAAQAYIYLTMIAPKLNRDDIAVAITIFAMIILTAFALKRLYKDHDLFFGLTIVWGLAGIFIRHVGELAMLYPLVIVASAIMIIGIMAVIIALVLHVDETRVIPET